VHPAEFFDDQCLYTLLLTLRNTVCHGSLDTGKRLNLWPPDHFADGLLDEITPSQAKGIGLGQILLYREIFLRRTFVGPDVVSDARMLVSKLW
jgi:hypothetical protein